MLFVDSSGESIPEGQEGLGIWISDFNSNVVYLGSTHQLHLVISQGIYVGTNYKCAR